jgi:hypothetical protein
VGHRLGLARHVARGEGEQLFRAAPVLGELLRHGHAHVPDGQADEHAREPAALRVLERLHHVLGALVAHALEARQLLRREAEQVVRAVHPRVLDDLHQQRLAHAVDVHGLPPREVLEALEHLVGTRRVGAEHEDLLADHRAPTGGALRGRHEGHGAVGTGREVHAHHLRDDVARLLHEHQVANAHVFASELGEVVQRRAAHGGAGQRHRVQLGHGRELAALAHLHADGAQPRGAPLGRELVGDAPVGVVAGGAERRVVRELVHLDDHPVDLEGQPMPALVVARAVRIGGARVRRHEQLVQVQPHQRLGAWHSAHVGQPRHHFALAAGQRDPLTPRDLVEERTDAHGPEARRVFALHHAGTAVARVGDGLLAGVPQALVVRVERIARPVQLATHLERAAGHAAQGTRSRLGLQHLRGDHVAALSITACHGPHQPAALVEQRHADAVDLGLHQQRQRAARAELEVLQAALVPRVQLHLVGHGLSVGVAPVGRELLERQHGHAVRHRLEAVRVVHARAAVDALLRGHAQRVGQLLIAVEQLVEGAVRDLGRALAVERLVVCDLFPQERELLLGLLGHASPFHHHQFLRLK